MPECIEMGCLLEQDRNRVCVLHELKVQAEQLEKDLAAAIAEVNRQLEEERTAKEEADEAHREELHRQHHAFTEHINQLEAELARAREAGHAR